ncbi:MAG: LamG-like jellyroll fold domain-containing protein, partial [Cocleimonas sp.]
DEGQSSFLIESDNAAYYYQKQAGGFSSLVDNDGNDWISYHPEISGVSGAANQFRGLPNLVSPANGGHFHPGATSVISVLIHEGPLKATIESITNDGLWKVQWEFFPKFSRMTVNLAEKNFWFLYEGTPGGTLDTSDFVMRSNGIQNSVNASWTSDINDPEWLYFSDPNIGSGRSLFLAHHNDDSEVDSYRPMDSANDLQMTVFGFGRNVLNSLIDKNQTHQFTIGLTDSTDFANTSATIESAYNTITAVITANNLNPETPTDSTPPVMSAINTAVTETTAVITWTTDEPSIGVVNYGINNSYGINAADTNTVLATVHSVTLNNLTAATEYHFEVVSTDESSNSSMSQDHVLITNPPPSTGGELVAHWSLREGTGVTVNDNTANGHNGHNGTLINGPIWSGNELIFDGVNDHVNVGSFDISGEALTLTGWVKSDDLGSCGFFKDCRIVSKASGTSEQNHYWMISTIRVGSATRLRFRLKAGGVTSTLIASSGNLTSGELFHVAATYDGTTIRLYKDGIEVGSLAKSGSLDVNNTVNIWIGDNPPVLGTRRPWKGLIADIRVYQKALTAIEVNAVKDIEINTVDTTPPTIVGTVNAAITDTSVTLTWTTDEPSTSTVNYGGSIPYSNTDETDSTLATSHSVTLSDLTLNSEYHFEIVSTDGSTNSNTSLDQTFTATIAADTTPSVVSNIQTTVTDTTAAISWTTDEPTNGAVNYGTDNSYGADAVDANTILATSHSVTLSGLTAETEYHFEVVSTDGSTNSSISPDQILMTTTASSVNVGLVAHWSLDEGSGTVGSDRTGNSHDGTLINGPVWNGNDLVFDGVNDYVTVGSFDISGEALTLTGWVKSDNLGSCSSYRDCRIISKASGTSEQDHYWMISTIRVGSTTRLRFRLKAGGSTSTLIASSGNLTNGELFHVAATYDGATMRLYKDGVEVGSLTKIGNIDVNNSVDVWIGDNPSVAGTRPWKGVISDVRIYQTALTEIEVNTIKDLLCT